MQIAKTFTLLFLVALLASCATSNITSVVGEEVGKKVYSNPIILIPYVDEAAEVPSNKLRENLQALFKADGRDFEIVVYPQKQEELKLNNTSPVSAMVNERVKADKDLVIVFRTKALHTLRGALLSITYIVAATDAGTKREIWKAESINDNFTGPSDFGKKAAAAIYGKLKADKVL
jgi:hypothetical protein